MNSKFLGMLSLAMRAGKLAPGEGKAEDAVRSSKAKLILISNDASDNTEKKFSDMGAYHKVPVLKIADRYETGRAIGRDFAVVIAVTDDNFANQLLKLRNETV